MELPLESSTSQTGIVKSEFPCMIVLFHLESEQAIKGFSFDIVFHLCSDGIGTLGVIEIKCSVSDCSLV